MDVDDWDARYRDAELVWSAEPNRFVEEVCRELPPGRSIDLAAGECRNAIWLAELGWDSTAIDYSAVAIEKGRRLAASRGVPLHAEVADLTSYEPPPSSYDLVLLAYLQLPSADLAPIVARAARAVAPGGTFLLVAHDVQNLDRGVGGPKNVDVLTTPEQIVSAIGAELVVERSEVADRPVSTDAGERTARDTVVVARRR